MKEVWLIAKEVEIEIVEGYQSRWETQKIYKGQYDNIWHSLDDKRFLSLSFNSEHEAAMYAQALPQDNYLLERFIIK